MTDENKRPKVLIVGGGLVGALNALFFARTQKYDIILCEKASDIRGTDRIIGRSINLSLSHRGLTALKIIGLNEKILKASIPMYARMVHGVDEDLTRFPYGSSDQCISAIDRKLMNDILLTEVERNGNIQLFFNMKLINVDFRKKIAKFTTEKGYYEIVFDFLVGNDGAHSTVRQYMSKNIRMDFSEEYIAHGYLEIHFPPGVSKKHLMHKNCLHVWPRNEFMLIGLPNLDGSFTGILFMPFEYYDEIKSNEDLFKFFQFNFPDALRLIGKSNLERMFFANQPAKMVTIRCTPYNFDGLCVIMGDAAHAMVPFYGQGMNSGFEDVIIFHEILQKNDYDLDKTCFEFTKNRNLDAKAMCDLAYFNYEELRINVTLLSFRLRKIIDNFMNYLFPSFWIPLYAMVCFTRIPYTKCLEEKQKQDKILMRLRKMVLSVIFGSLLILTNNVIHNRTAI